MLRVRFLLHVLLLRSCHFLQLPWTPREWGRVAGYFAGKDLAEAPFALEQSVCRLTGSEYALGLNLGRSAIQVALEAFNLPPDSEVILPSFSCAGVIMPVIQAGLQPVLADVDRDFNLRAASVAAGLSHRTRAIILAHLSGKFARDTDTILDLAKSRGIKVIEDACQAFGLRKDGRWAGTFGDVGVFSFGLGKNLFGPGGGMLVTDDAAVISHCRSRAFPREESRRISRRLQAFVAQYGCPRGAYLARVIAKIPGLCLSSSPEDKDPKSFAHPVYRISDIEAALAQGLVARHQEIIARRRANSLALLASEALVRTGLDLPDPGHHIFTKFLVSTAAHREAADSLREFLNSHGVETEFSYVPLHLRPPFAGFRCTELTETESRWRAAFSIPVNPRLHRKDLSRIMRILESFKN